MYENSIKQAIIDIFTSKEVISAADTFARHTAFSLGRIVGSVASIGISIAENITGAVARYFEGNSDFIKESLQAEHLSSAQECWIEGILTNCIVPFLSRILI